MSINHKLAILVTTAMGLILNTNTFTLKAMNNQNQFNYVDDESQSYVPLESDQASNLFHMCIASHISVYRLPDNTLVFSDLSEVIMRDKVIKATLNSPMVPLHPIFKSIFADIGANNKNEIKTQNSLFGNGIIIFDKANRILWYNTHSGNAMFTNEDKSADGYIKVLPNKISQYVSEGNGKYYMNMVKEYDKVFYQLPIQQFLNQSTDKFCKIPLTSSKFVITNSMMDKFVCLSILGKRVHVKSIKDFKTLKNDERWLCTFEDTDFNNLFEASNSVKSSAYTALDIPQNNGGSEVNNNSSFQYLWNCNIF